MQGFRKGVKRGEASFAKYNEEERSGRCILLQPLRREGASERKYTIGEMGEPAEEEKEKTEREYSKTYTKKIYKEEIANVTNCPVDNTLKRLTKN